MWGCHQTPTIWAAIALNSVHIAFSFLPSGGQTLSLQFRSCVNNPPLLLNELVWWTNYTEQRQQVPRFFFPSSSPFDVEDLTLSSGNVSKATALQRRVSVYSQGTPETPTFQDTSFFVSPTQTPASAALVGWETVDFVVVELHVNHPLG